MRRVRLVKCIYIIYFCTGFCLLIAQHFSWPFPRCFCLCVCLVLKLFFIIRPILLYSWSFSLLPHYYYYIQYIYNHTLACEKPPAAVPKTLLIFSLLFVCICALSISVHLVRALKLLHLTRIHIFFFSQFAAFPNSFFFFLLAISWKSDEGWSFNE